MSVEESPVTSSEATASTAGAGLAIEVRPDGVAILTFDRPDVMNAINWPLYQELLRLYREVAVRPDIKVLVLRGAGRAFCAGGDIEFMRQMDTGEIDKRAVNALSMEFFRAHVSLPQPTIAVVDGPAIGLGVTIALTCDVIFAGERARFADPHVQMGLVPGDGGPVIWPMLVGVAKAKELLFTGDVVRADDALRLGLVNHVHPSDEVLDRALAFAARLAQGPAFAIQATKSLVNLTLRTLGEQVVTQGLALEMLSQDTDYHRTAVARFLADDPIRF
jgi:enoyl-CoA hydratase